MDFLDPNRDNFYGPYGKYVAFKDCLWSSIAGSTQVPEAKLYHPLAPSQTRLVLTSLNKMASMIFSWWLLRVKKHHYHMRQYVIHWETQPNVSLMSIHSSLRKSLIVSSCFVLAFALGVAWKSAMKPEDVLVATAAYSAVLVAFVGVNTSGATH